MAGKEKKGRKFGRNLNRSNAAKMYKLVKRDMTNKLAKLRRHMKHNPNDAQSAVALKNGGSGNVIKFKKDVIEAESRSVYDKPLKLNFKNRRVYMLYVNGSCLDVDTSFENVKKSFDKSNCNAALCVRDGAIIKILQTKRSTPFVENSYKLREFLKNAS